MNHFDSTVLGRLLEPTLSLRLALTLLHFLWQGALLGIVALAADRALRRASSRSRYAMFAGVLVAMGAALPTTFLLVRVDAERNPTPPPTALVSAPIVLTNASPAFKLPPAEAALPITTLGGDVAIAPVSALEPADSSPAQQLTVAIPPRRGIEPYAAAIAIAYLVGIVLMLARLAMALHGGRRLRLAATPNLDGPIAELVRRQAQRIGLKAVPVVAWCGRISVPVVVGIVRPMILLPTAFATGFDPSQLEALLTHELAHIRRFDPLVNLLQRLIEVLLFFHPAVWYVSRRVSAERENACDDLVVSAGWPAVSYAQALLQMAELCAAARGISPQSNAALAASGSGSSQFKRRVLRLLEIDDAPRLRLSRGGLLLVTGAAILVFSSSPLIRAVTKIPEESKPERQIAQAQPGAGSSDDLKRPGKTRAKPEPLVLRVDLPQASANSGVRIEQKDDVNPRDSKRDTGSSPQDARPPQAIARLEPTGGPALRGTVIGADGKPVAGTTVIIWAAGVTFGYSTYCPGCYADCDRRTVTDSQGVFTIPHVSPDLRFQLLLVHRRYTPTLVNHVDPFKGPVTVTVDRRESPSDPAGVVRGRIVGPTGIPLCGAIVAEDLVSFRVSSGPVKGSDPLAVTDDQGAFEIAYLKPGAKRTLMVQARGMAPRRFEVRAGERPYTLAMSRGATVRGRLLQFGKPLGHAEMGLMSRDRSALRYVPEQRIGTESDGSFEFMNIPAPGDWYVYAKMESISRFGATAAVAAKTNRDDQVLDLGAIEVAPGHRIRGRVVLSDGKRIPAGMRITISTRRAWDSQTTLLARDGRFEFVGLPTDDYSLNASVKGYRLSAKNPHLSWTIEGVIDRDLDDFLILLDPGQEDFKGRSAGKFQGQPLRSAQQP